MCVHRKREREREAINLASANLIKTIGKTIKTREIESSIGKPNQNHWKNKNKTTKNKGF